MAKLRILAALVVWLFCSYIPGFGQITDNFSDGNFINAPVWSGHDTDFVVNTANQLQLNSSGTSTSYLKLNNSQPLDNCEWDFWIHLNFPPSSSNYARVYLVSDQPDLTGNLNGYYLQFGESLSNDQVELFRQSGSTSISVCRGTTLIANAFSIRAKVVRDTTGFWRLYIDPTGGNNFTLEASGPDNTVKNGSCFGICCKYTSANSTHFFFDDFYIYAPPDLTPAKLDSVKVISSNKVDAYFNESLSTVSAQTIANYSIDKGIAYPVSAQPDTNDPTLVHLTLGSSFSNGQYYTLTVTGVQDLYGNNTINATKTFLYFSPQANDIQINEIMADVNPAPNALPPYEYIELYNRAAFPAVLKGWTLSDGSSTATIPDLIIQADSFYVLTSSAAVSAFTGIQVAGVSSFPSLNDAGDDLVLRDASGKIISVAFYKSDWYNDPIKGDGGWSMEQINPNSPCAGKANWKASADNSGGTPGRKNSVYGNTPDTFAPSLSHVTILSSNSIQLFFDEYMDSTTLVNLSSFSIDNSLGVPVSADPVEPDYTSVVLTLSSGITPGILYTVSVSSAKDCAGNSISQNNTAQFAAPEPVAENDIVINEIMFDPKDNGVEWVEIYNRSNKIVDIKELYLCSYDNSGMLAEINQVAPNGYLMLPSTYIVLSTDASAIEEQYSTNNPNGFINMTSIPSLSNDSDHIVLANASQVIIDKVHYNTDWHLPLLNDTKGFSLERVNFENLSQDKNNWHSASEIVGGATPAFQNSQYTTGEGGTEVLVSPEIFSPDNDGYNDVLSIAYAFDTPGFIANVQICDSRGRLEKTLVRNELLGTSGTFFWDGITDEKLKARIGIYVIYFEVFDTSGNVKKYKKACVVAGRL